MNPNNIDIILEALLFVKTEPLSIKKLSEILKTDEDTIKNSIQSLKEKLNGRGVRLLLKGDEVMLGTAPEASSVIEAILKEELSKDLGRAGIETIAIVLYKGPVTKNEIDFIRGVNSQFILRNLLVRGMVERIQNPNGRGALYRSTFDLLRHMGVMEINELPDYEEIRKTLNNFKEHNEDEQGEVPE